MTKPSAKTMSLTQTGSYLKSGHFLEKSSCWDEWWTLSTSWAEMEYLSVTELKQYLCLKSWTLCGQVMPGVRLYLVGVWQLVERGLITHYSCVVVHMQALVRCRRIPYRLNSADASLDSLNKFTWWTVRKSFGENLCLSISHVHVGQ